MSIEISPKVWSLDLSLKFRMAVLFEVLHVEIFLTGKHFMLVFSRFVSFKLKANLKLNLDKPVEL